MKNLIIILLLLIVSCENPLKKKSTTPAETVSIQEMEVYINEDSLVTLSDTSEIWVKRVFPAGKSDQIAYVNTNGKEKIVEYNGIASLDLFDCKQKLFIVDEMYYFFGNAPVYEVDNRSERIEDKSQWSKIEPGTYIEKIYQFVCKPAVEE